MESYRVEYRPEALEATVAIVAYVLEASQNRVTAERYIERLYDRCERIGDAPFAGVARSDLGANLRMAVFEKSIVILYAVEDNVVSITNIFSGGQDYQTLLRDH
ncbi:plasmid stabilization protein [Rhizobium sp. Root708]|uniref:type II toxin-antitoxin system RelE/ParE family toxin n=1 Tax=Rhizobium sp. Root708 TaxID=1736592 RepID=UPI0006F578AA|nr:type II toxin-antitoxin system RelE/ParE family toxin [Rhizobium sp. Root708]KRB50117.1 plasmid stabilization protein [Rhizobium sp. Root708]